MRQTCQKKNDLAKYSGTSLISTTLYNIRRERRDEFIAEGFRKDDLFRWRALDMMQNYSGGRFQLLGQELLELYKMDDL
jgi:hypothetical protein